jgi:hypothetical protein
MLVKTQFLYVDISYSDKIIKNSLKYLVNSDNEFHLSYFKKTFVYNTLISLLITIIINDYF